MVTTATGVPATVVAAAATTEDVAAGRTVPVDAVAGIAEEDAVDPVAAAGPLAAGAAAATPPSATPPPPSPTPTPAPTPEDELVFEATAALALATTTTAAAAAAVEAEAAEDKLVGIFVARAT